jgi:hypothetical protein
MEWDERSEMGHRSSLLRIGIGVVLLAIPLSVGIFSYIAFSHHHVAVFVVLAIAVIPCFVMAPLGVAGISEALDIALSVWRTRVVSHKR